jgi:hypothetical protein
MEETAIGVCECAHRAVGTARQQSWLQLGASRMTSSPVSDGEDRES